MSAARVTVQTEGFDVGREMEALRLLADGSRRTDMGAIGCFVGLVRDLNLGSEVSLLKLEHYPGMTENSIEEILQEAESRWPLLGLRVIHRVGTLAPSDEIVLVLAASAHREAALESTAFIMDYLKTRSPFWKKEATPEGERWVEERASDLSAAQRWDEADESVSRLITRDSAVASPITGSEQGSR